MESNEKRIYRGLYGSDKIEFTKGLIHINPFGIIGKEHKNNVLQHAHNDLFQLFLIQSGTTNFICDSKSITINEPTIITVPKNTEHGFEHQSDLNGWIITLSDIVLEHMLHRDAEVVHSLDHVQIIPITSEPLIDEVENTIYKCVLEYNSKHSGRLLMLQYLVGQLIVLLHRIPKDQKSKLNAADHSSTIYFRRFSQIIKQSVDFKKTVDQYANELGITPGHLNKVCQSVASQSPKEILLKYFVTHAQLLLSDVNLTIAEVSYKLNFSDKSYFSRVFKEKTGKTPLEFRKSLNT